MMSGEIKGITEMRGILQINPANIGITHFEKLATNRIFYGIDFKTEDRGILEKIERYIINENATIIFWKDGNKTISRVDAEDVFNKEIGFMLAIYKYLSLYCEGESWSKTELKKELECIKTDKLYDFLFITFNKFTFKDTNKAKRYLSELKVEKSKKKIKSTVNNHKTKTIDNLTALEEKLNLEQKKDIEFLEEICEKIKEESKGTKKIFSKKKCIETLGHESCWMEECDGKEVVNGYVGIYRIEDDWCEVK